MLDMCLAPACQDTAPHIVILGVTPEVVQLSWPRSATLRAFDISADMIARVWQPNSRTQSHVAQSRWQALPIESNSVDAVVGDGCLTALQGIAECKDVLSEVARVLKPAGSLVIRCFIRPTTTESLEEIVADVAEKKIRHFGTLKWRLAMALCHGDNATVRPKDISGTFNSLFPDRQTLHYATDWPLETIGTIDSYDGMEGYFTFMTRTQLEDTISPFFRIKTIKQGGYELSERCPTIAFTRLS